MVQRRAELPGSNSGEAKVTSKVQVSQVVDALAVLEGIHGYLADDEPVALFKRLTNQVFDTAIASIEEPTQFPIDSVVQLAHLQAEWALRIWKDELAGRHPSFTNPLTAALVDAASKYDKRRDKSSGEIAQVSLLAAGQYDRRSDRFDRIAVASMLPVSLMGEYSKQPIFDERGKVAPGMHDEHQIAVGAAMQKFAKLVIAEKSRLPAEVDSDSVYL